MSGHYTDQGRRDQRWLLLADRITETYTEKAAKWAGNPDGMAFLEQDIYSKLVGMIRYIGDGQLVEGFVECRHYESPDFVSFFQWHIPHTQQVGPLNKLLNAT